MSAYKMEAGTVVGYTRLECSIFRHGAHYRTQLLVHKCLPLGTHLMHYHMPIQLTSSEGHVRKLVTVVQLCLEEPEEAADMSCSPLNEEENTPSKLAPDSKPIHYSW